MVKECVFVFVSGVKAKLLCCCTPTNEFPPGTGLPASQAHRRAFIHLADQTCNVWVSILVCVSYGHLKVLQLNSYLNFNSSNFEEPTICKSWV